MKRTLVITGFTLFAAFGMLSCKKDYNSTEEKEKETITQTDQSAFLKELDAASPQQESFTKDASKTFEVTSKNGNQYIFPASAFVDASGNPITGQVDVSVREIFNKSDMLLSGMTTMSNQGPLTSGGEIEVVVKQNGKKVYLKNGVSYEAQISTKQFDNDMSLWTLNNYKNSNNQWEEVNQTTIEDNCERLKTLMDAIDGKNNPGGINKVVVWLKKTLLSRINDATGGGKDFNIRVFPSNGNNNFNQALDFNTQNENWNYSGSSGNNWDSVMVGGNATEYSNDYWNYQSYINAQTITIHAGQCSFSFTDGAINYTVSLITGEVSYNVSINFLGWCNIDRLLSEYGSITNCNISFSNGSVPDGAVVAAVFSELNGALPYELQNGKWIISRLPDGAPIEVVVYYIENDKVKYCKHSAKAAKSITIDLSTLKEINKEGLISELKKLD